MREMGPFEKSKTYGELQVRDGFRRRRKRDLSMSWKVMENRNQTRFESGERKKKLESQKGVGFGDLEEEHEASDARKGTTIHAPCYPLIMVKPPDSFSFLFMFSFDHNQIPCSPLLRFIFRVPKP